MAMAENMRSALSLCIISLTVTLICPKSGLAGYAVPGVYEPPEDYFGQTVTLIDFDYDPTGAAIADNTAISNQYESWGAVFEPSDSSPASQWMRTHSGSSGGFANDWISQPNTLAADHTDSSATPIRIKVIFPEEMFISMPTRVGIVFTDSSPDNPFTVKALNSAGELVDSVEIDTADDYYDSSDRAEDTFCGVRFTGGIYSIEFGTDKRSNPLITGLEVDNLYHNGILVPEPASLLLLGLGGLALLRRGVRRNRQ